MPPKISDLPAKSPPLEVLPPELPRPGTAARAADGPPIHALSALVLLAVDNLWNLAEWVVLDWIITVPLSFVTVFVPVFLLQKEDGNEDRDKTQRDGDDPIKDHPLREVPKVVHGEEDQSGKRVDGRTVGSSCGSARPR